LFLNAAGSLPVTVSGGISCIDDVIALREFEAQGLVAVIIGKALYDRRLILQDAMKVAGQ
jgi:phosphoribosylformimino-5-aminoimidazole carboxamide ribotide isomerase